MAPSQTPASFQTESKNKLIKLFFIYTSLLLSWFLPPTQGLWSSLDIEFFRSMNGTLHWHPYWKLFWAYMNADFLDRLMELLIFSLTFWGIYRLPGAFKRNLFSFFKYYISFTLIFILVKWCLQKGVAIKRLSPSFVLEDTIRLKGVIDYKLKDASRNSFPADHALFLFLMYLYAKNNFDRLVKGLLLFVVVLFTFPRLISGGHWFTDVFFGAWVPSILFSAAWFSKDHLWAKEKKSS